MLANCGWRALLTGNTGRRGRLRRFAVLASRLGRGILSSSARPLTIVSPLLVDITRSAALLANCGRRALLSGNAGRLRLSEALCGSCLALRTWHLPIQCLGLDDYLDPPCSSCENLFPYRHRSRACPARQQYWDLRLVRTLSGYCLARRRLQEWMPQVIRWNGLSRSAFSFRRSLSRPCLAMPRREGLGI